jgi:hypothetical protein
VSAVPDGYHIKNGILTVLPPTTDISTTTIAAAASTTATAIPSVTEDISLVTQFSPRKFVPENALVEDLENKES